MIFLVDSIFFFLKDFIRNDLSLSQDILLSFNPLLKCPKLSDPLVDYSFILSFPMYVQLNDQTQIETHPSPGILILK